MNTSSPSSPSTPSCKRRSLRLSSFDVPPEASPSPYTSGTTSNTNFSRRSSRTSQTSYQPASPLTPRPMSSRSSRHSLHRRKSSRASVNSFGVTSIRAEASGLGNLADELDQVWDDDMEPEQQGGSSFLDDLREGNSAVEVAEIQSPYEMSETPDFGHINSSVASPSPQESHQTLQIPPSPQTRKQNPTYRKHTRTDSAYDGSDYGSDNPSDDELSFFPPLLRKRIRELNTLTTSLATNDSVSEAGGVVSRTTAALKDLGPPQSTIEYGLTRLVTAYTSMSTHRTHQQREIFRGSHSLLYSNGAGELPDELLELMIEEIAQLTESTAFLRAQQNPLLSLQILASQTSDLTHNLRSLTDALQESKMLMASFSRKLKSVRDMVAELREEEDLVEDSMMLIQGQGWDRRIRERHAGAACRDVVKGFGVRWGIDVPVLGVVGKVGG